MYFIFYYYIIYFIFYYYITYYVFYILLLYYIFYILLYIDIFYFIRHTYRNIDLRTKLRDNSRILSIFQTNSSILSNFKILE